MLPYCASCSISYVKLAPGWPTWVLWIWNNQLHLRPLLPIKQEQAVPPGFLIPVQCTPHDAVLPLSCPSQGMTGLFIEQAPHLHFPIQVNSSENKLLLNMYLFPSYYFFQSRDKTKHGAAPTTGPLGGLPDSSWEDWTSFLSLQWLKIEVCEDSGRCAHSRCPLNRHGVSALSILETKNIKRLNCNLILVPSSSTGRKTWFLMITCICDALSPWTFKGAFGLMIVLKRSLSQSPPDCLSSPAAKHPATHSTGTLRDFLMLLPPPAKCIPTESQHCLAPDLSVLSEFATVTE